MSTITQAHVNRLRAAVEPIRARSEKGESVAKTVGDLLPILATEVALLGQAESDLEQANGRLGTGDVAVRLALVDALERVQVIARNASEVSVVISELIQLRNRQVEEAIHLLARFARASGPS